MNLRTALRIDQRTCLAFVGSGGKTSALFRLAAEIPGPVIVTCSTHLALEQAQMATQHWQIERAEDLKSIQSDLTQQKIALITGTSGKDNRVTGLDALSLEALNKTARQNNISLLIEADGSRRKPLKAPAAHEPAIPPWVDEVVVCVGLSGLGKPMDAENVHRPERFAAVTGLADCDPVTLDALFKYLVSREGGRKNIPAQARTSVLLNQADTVTNWREIFSASRTLLSDFDAVLLAALQQNDPKGEVFAVQPRAAGILLASGEAHRFGSQKLLLPWRGHALVWHAARAGLDAGLNPLIVVTGSETEEIRSALDDLPVEIVSNPDWQEGQSASIRTGVQQLGERADAVVFLLGDQPLVTANVIVALLDRYGLTLASIVAPQVNGRRANPVLFDRNTFADLLRLSGDAGGRILFERYPLEMVSFADPGLLFDVDTPTDYERLKKMFLEEE